MNVLIVAIVAALILCIFLSRNKELVENWRDAPRWYSTWAFASIATIQGSVLAFITEKQLAAPVLLYPSLTWGEASQAVVAFLAVTGGVARLLSQKKTAAAPEAEQP